MFAKVGLFLIVLAVVAKAQILDKRYGIEFGTINYPSGPFEKTKEASPSVDLSQPIVLLPEATPIHEQPQESQIKETVQAPTASTRGLKRTTTTSHPRIPNVRTWRGSSLLEKNIQQ